MSATAASGATVGVAIRELGEWVVGLDWDGTPADVRASLLLALEDTLGVAIAGAQTPELRALRRVQPLPGGPTRVLGTEHDAAVETATWLNGTAACCLELDEGNKFARGHPAAHAFPAALALAQERGASGRDLCTALLAGHEVAARFGRATTLRPGTHPHGNWGVAGAAAAAGQLLGLDGERIAGAIDAAGALALAAPFEVALRGSFVRNTWIGSANVNGIAAARLAAAGLTHVDGTPREGLGLLGDFDTGELTADLGTRFDVALGYFKRHASCSYTHPPADAALELRRSHTGPDWSEAVSINVETHGLAAPLDRREVSTRLAAMFSIPYVTAVALLHGDLSPARFDERHRADPAVRRLMESTTVVESAELDALLPDKRAARLTIELDGGRRVVAEVSNPVGDADHRPFGPAEIADKLDALLRPHGLDAAGLRRIVAQLPEATDASQLLRDLPAKETP
jgi:2-methylcitrate dehydratase PrpD